MRRSAQWQLARIAVLMAMMAPMAQGQTPAPAPPPPAAAPAAPAKAPASKEQLDQMTAQIALYPDSLLSQVLMATTYPDESPRRQVVEGASGRQGRRSGQDGRRAELGSEVQSLVAFPEVLHHHG